MKNSKTQDAGLLEPGNEDNFFSPIGNTKPYLKLALQGFAGSGKTYTGALIAIGLYKYIGSKKPLVIFDTEESSKFLVPLFKKHGIVAVNRRSRSLADLKEVFTRCREGYSDIVMIDSISHVWENFLEAYKKSKNRTRLEFQDWGLIKPTWKAEFSDPFVRDPFHCIMTGRAGYEYETEVNAETHKREIYKSGIKMKVEGETAYEPDILVMMERYEKILEKEDRKVWREGMILKDRSTLLDGQVFTDPGFKDFLPSIKMIMSNPVDPTAQIEGNAGDLVKTEEDKMAWRRRKDIALEKIEGILTTSYPGQSAAEKKQKVLALEKAYGTKSWTEVQGLPVEKIEEGHAILEKYCADNAIVRE